MEILSKKEEFRMTEKQIEHAKEFLLKLYAEQYGFKNPKITIAKEKGEKKDA